MNIDNLVGKGYFPEELTPAFTPNDLVPLLPAILPLLDTYDPLTKRDKFDSKCCTFSIPKPGGYRRTISVPNPLHQIRLSHTIVSNWGAITALANTSGISGSKLIPGGPRALEKPSFEGFIEQRINRSVGRRYLLKIDISRFYNSIYTHSIPWALHSKSVSKGERRRNMLFGNQLDEDCRKTMDGQTIGIPVGPDTSRVISELILAAIDQKITDQLPPFSGIRIIDDYYLYLDNLGDVEIARGQIHKIMAEFELELNPSKDIIHKVPEIMESKWYADLKMIRFSRSPAAQRKQLISFFDLAITYAKDHPDDAVMSYAISKIRNLEVHYTNFKLLQSLMLNAMLLESKVISILSEVFGIYRSLGFPLEADSIKHALQEFIKFHLDLGNEYEVFWAMWTMKTLRLKVDKTVAEKLAQSDNPIIILTYLHLRHSKLITRRVDVSAWEAMLNEANLYNEYWLVAYEAKVRGWLTSPDNYIDTDDFFKVLADNKVRFYHPNAGRILSSVTIGSPSMMAPESAHDLL